MNKSKVPGAEAFAGWAERPGKPGGKAAGKEDRCGRCGEKVHYKRDCKKVCEECGLD